MRSVLILKIAMGIAGALMSGCSSCNDVAEQTNSNQNNATIVVPKEDNSKNPYGANGNTKVVPYNGNTNLNGNPTLDNSKVTVVDTKNVKPSVPSRPLPENSVLTTEMNAKGYVIETRTFKGDQLVRKIERITVTPKEVTVKVYLRNGKVKTLPDGKLRDFRIATIGQILEAVGEKVPVPTGSPAKSKEQTTNQPGGKVSN